MGVATILDARRVRVLAFGARKAAIVRATLRSAPGPGVPATWLHDHADVRLYLDPEAAGELD
jgi:glucosamine-6-phosphate deaminase